MTRDFSDFWQDRQFFIAKLLLSFQIISRRVAAVAELSSAEKLRITIARQIFFATFPIPATSLCQKLNRQNRHMPTSLQKINQSCLPDGENKSSRVN